MAEHEECDVTQVQPQSQNILDIADVTFLVEDREVKAVKSVLMLNSPVFKAMFMNEFKEKASDQIPLPGKVYEDFVEFMEIMHAFFPKLQGKNVMNLVPLAHEYQVPELLDKLEDCLIKDPVGLHHVLFADKYDLKTLRQKAINEAASRELEELEQEDCFKELKPAILMEIIKLHIQKLKDKNDDLIKIALMEKEWRKTLQEIKYVFYDDCKNYSICPAGGHIRGTKLIETTYKNGTSIHNGCGKCHTDALSRIYGNVVSLKLD